MVCPAVRHELSLHSRVAPFRLQRITKHSASPCTMWKRHPCQEDALRLRYVAGGVDTEKNVIRMPLYEKCIWSTHVPAVFSGSPSARTALCGFASLHRVITVRFSPSPIPDSLGSHFTFPFRCSHLNAYQQQLSPPDFFLRLAGKMVLLAICELSEKSGGLGKIAL